MTRILPARWRWRRPRDLVVRIHSPAMDAAALATLARIVTRAMGRGR